MSDQSPVELLFLGTGTSAGVPMIGCHCEVCSSTDPRDFRNRTSAMISYGGKNIVIDTTPEFRLACVSNRIDVIEAVVFTHAHADHIMGLDDVRRFNMTNGFQAIDAWGDAPTHELIEKCFGYAFRSYEPELKVFRPQLVRRVIDGPFGIAGKTWTPIPLMHGNQKIHGYRVDDVAYCTDVSEIPQSSYALLEGLDVLVLNTLRWKPHPTHFTIDQSLDAARRIGANQTLFVHMAHDLPHAATNAKLPANMQLAYDGQRVTSHGR